MASYRLRIKPSAVKELEAVPKEDRKRIVSKIAGLASEPGPSGVEKLSGQDKYRLRHGDHRVLYGIDDDDATVVIVKIGHRREVYR